MARFFNPTRWVKDLVSFKEVYLIFKMLNRPKRLYIEEMELVLQRVRRHRSTKAEMAEYRDLIVQIAKVNRPVTVRQIYYQLVAAGEVDKTGVSTTPLSTRW